MTSFAERCAIAQKCVPESEFRDRLTALHAEMLDAIAASAPLQAQIEALEADAQRSLEERIAMAVDQARLQLPKSYGGSTLDVQEKGATLRLHFTDATEAEAWFKAITKEGDAMGTEGE